jgi:hypothetical protein
MSFDLQKILESKRSLRHNLAAHPLAEKLRILDALRERELAIRGHDVHCDSSTNIQSDKSSQEGDKQSGTK